MINKFFYFSAIILFSTITVWGQSSIECNLSNLSKLTLKNNLTIRRGELSIDGATANTIVQGSVFDYQLISSASASQNKENLFDVDPRNDILSGKLESFNSDFSIGLQRKFRSGLYTNLSLDYTQYSDNYPFNRFSQEVGSYISDHKVSTTLSLTQPLLKGRGEKNVAVAEKVSILNLESAKNNYSAIKSNEFLQMGVAYWQYLGAYKSLIIYKENEQRVRNVLQNTMELVKADKKPASDLYQIQADLANQERQTKQAEQSLHNTRLNLGRTIGLDEKESQKIGIPKNEFPEIFDSNFNKNINIEKLMRSAVANRADIKSYETILEGLELQLASAKNSLKPQLDLTGFVNYGGMNMGNGIDYAFNTFTNKQGSNYLLGLKLNLQLPLNNKYAKGSFLQSKTTLEEKQASYENLKNNSNINVNITFHNLINSVSILEKASESLALYKKVFANEEEKFHNGMTTLLNLLLLQERLTYSQLEYIRSQQQFAIAILNLRYETGTLLTVKDNLIVTQTNDVFYQFPIIK